MNAADPVEQGLWNEIEVKEEWVGLPGRRPNPIIKALSESLGLVKVCVLAFAVGVVLGYVLFEESASTINPLLDGLKAEVGVGVEEQEFGLAARIFLHNMRSSLILFLSGILLFIPLLLLMFNGFLVGFVFRLLVERGHPPALFVLGVLPHGVFELPAFFFTAAIGLRIGLSLFFPKGGRVKALKESIRAAGAVYISVVLPLLLLSAFIEAYISSALIM